MIQIDYDEKWFRDPSIRTLNDDMLAKVKEGLSPFKAEIASYIKIIALLSRSTSQK